MRPKLRDSDQTLTNNDQLINLDSSWKINLIRHKQPTRNNVTITVRVKNEILYFSEIKCCIILILEYFINFQKLLKFTQIHLWFLHKYSTPDQRRTKWPTGTSERPSVRCYFQQNEGIFNAFVDKLWLHVFSDAFFLQPLLTKRVKQ